MVVFTCNHCGESLQKPRVEKHYTFSCRYEKFLTCVDCFKDFRGNEYNVHTKCVTEEERYSGKDFVQKSKKGEIKQESWMEMIKSIIIHENNLSPNYKNLLNTISHYNNVPRKKVKFINFIKSSTGGKVNINDIEGIWNIIEKYKPQNTLSEKQIDTQIMQEEEKEKSNLQKENNGLKLKEKKRKASVIQENTENITEFDGMLPKKKKHSTTNGDNKTVNNIINGNDSSIIEIPYFSFDEHILQILMKKKQISMQRLCKKLANKFRKFSGEPIPLDKLEKKINKKLKKIDVLVVENDIVKLIEE